MRHIPTADWMARKLDNDLRRRIDKLVSSFASVAPSDARHASTEAEFRGLCKALERLCEAARPSTRHNGNNHHDLASRIETLLANGVAALRALEPTSFGRRNPYHAFDRSKAEPVYAALLAVIARVERVITIVRTIDPGIDERLLENSA